MSDHFFWTPYSHWQAPTRLENLRLGKFSDTINVLILFYVKILNIVETSINILPELHLALSQGMECLEGILTIDMMSRERVACSAQTDEHNNNRAPVPRYHR
jgi:hypothetical protein